MSKLNTKWLRANFQGKQAVIFDIGCADLGDTVNMQRAVRDGLFYAFECNDYFREANEARAVKHNISYHHVALSDTYGVTQFYPSASLNNQAWPWSGSIFAPGARLQVTKWRWGEPYTITTTTLKDFCDTHKTRPDFLHIDVQGAEHKVMSALGEYRPAAVWAEVSEFTAYQTDTTCLDFDKTMTELGYTKQYANATDALYFHHTAPLTPYAPR